MEKETGPKTRRQGKAPATDEGARLALLGGIIDYSDDAILSKTPEGILPIGTGRRNTCMGILPTRCSANHVSILMTEDRQQVHSGTNSPSSNRKMSAR